MKATVAQFLILSCELKLLDAFRSEESPPCSNNETAEYFSLPQVTQNNHVVSTNEAKYPWMASLHKLVIGPTVTYTCKSEEAPPESEWQSKCKEEFNEESSFNHFCGASLINHRFMLSAKHCLLHNERLLGLMPDGIWICRKENISDIVVILGTQNIGQISFEDGYEFVINRQMPSGPWYQIEEIILRNPELDSFDGLVINTAHDAALIKLTDNVGFTEDIKPISLYPRPLMLDLSKLTIAGWGANQEAKPNENVSLSSTIVARYAEDCSDGLLKMVKTADEYMKLSNRTFGVEDLKDFLSLKHFFESFDNLEVNRSITPDLTEKVSCIKSTEELANKQTCYGDSGGAIFAKSKTSSKAVLVGVVGRGLKSCNEHVMQLRKHLVDEKMFTYYMKATDCSLYDWIAKHSKDGVCGPPNQKNARHEFQVACDDEQMKKVRKIIERKGQFSKFRSVPIPMAVKGKDKNVKKQKKFHHLMPLKGIAPHVQMKHVNTKPRRAKKNVLKNRKNIEILGGGGGGKQMRNDSGTMSTMLLSVCIIVSILLLI